MIKELSVKKEIKEIGFPKFMIASDGMIIFAFDLKEQNVSGVVVRRARGLYGIGHYSDVWDKKCFSDYNEPITLQNEE